MSIIDEENKQTCLNIFGDLKFSIKQRDRHILNIRSHIKALKENKMYPTIFTEYQQKYIDCLLSQCDASDEIICTIEEPIKEEPIIEEPIKEDV